MIRVANKAPPRRGASRFQTQLTKYFTLQALGQEFDLANLPLKNTLGNPHSQGFRP